MILYMFQCHSPKSSHACLLPQSPKDCSIHLCFFCYLAYRIIVDIVYQLDRKTVQFSCSVMSDFLDQLGCSMPGFPVHHQHLELLKLMPIKSVIPSNHFIFCHSLLLLPSIFPSIRVFSNESILSIRWPKYWSCSFNISPSNKYSGMFSFRIDWLDLLAVQGTLKNLPQHHSSTASILLCSAFFMVQCSYPYMTTGKNIALTRQTFVSKVMSLLFNTLCKLMTAFLPNSKYLLISWLQSPSAVILEPKKK